MLLILLSKLLILVGRGRFQNSHLLISFVQVESHLLYRVLQVKLLLADNVCLKLCLFSLYLSSITLSHCLLVLFLKHIDKTSLSLQISL